LKQIRKTTTALLEKSNAHLLKSLTGLYISPELFLMHYEHTLKRIDFLVEKTKFFDRYSNQLNVRQLKVVQAAI
jgi:hypothetical protein